MRGGIYQHQQSDFGWPLKHGQLHFNVALFKSKEKKNNSNPNKAGMNDERSVVAHEESSAVALKSLTINWAALSAPTAVCTDHVELMTPFYVITYAITPNNK